MTDPVTPTLVLMAGMPGAGKSTIAQAIGATFGWPVIDKDVIGSSLLESGIPEEQMQSAAYDACFALARDLLIRQRCSLILDTPCVYPVVYERARALGDDARAVLIPVLCSAERDIRNERVATRLALRSQPAGQSRTPGYARERFAHLPADTIEVVTDGPVEEAMQQAVGAVRLRVVTMK